MAMRKDVSTRRRNRALRGVALFGLSITVIVPAMCLPAAAAGFFDMLFGPRDRQPIYVQPQRQYLPLSAGPTRRLARPVERAQPKPQRKFAKAALAHATSKVATESPAVLSGPLGQFLLDPTLRRGDVVVTSEGLKIFTGAASTQHSNADFTSLARAGQFVAGNSAVLTSIDRANRFSPQPLEDVQIQPAVRAAPAAPAQKATQPDKQASLDSSATR